MTPLSSHWMAEQCDDWRTDGADSPWDGTHLSTLQPQEADDETQE